MNSVPPGTSRLPLDARRAGVQLKQCKCPLCGTGLWSTIIGAPDIQGGQASQVFTVVQCQTCSLCFTNPRPGPEDIGQFYPQKYRPHRVSRNTRPLARWRRLRLWSKATCPERRVLPWDGEGRGRLLDFGCGGGRFLQSMHEAGWDVTGVDASSEAVQSIGQELGLRAVHGSLPHPDLIGEQFDLVTMMHSLEHVHQPLEVLQAAHRLLVPGGKLVVAVPNIDSLAMHWFGRNWFALDLPRHLTHFTPITLTRMLEYAGFCPRPVQPIGHPAWLRESARLACRNGKSRIWQRSLCSRTFSWAVARYSSWTAQADAMMVTALKK